MKKKQQGFTLVEIAIVLVIIGLLLGGVLKGQELINSAKVKSLANDFRTLPLLIYGYQDKFRRLPGDDALVTQHLGNNAILASGDGVVPGNGVIEGVWNSVNLTDENVLFWQHVRMAGLATGSTDFSTLDKAGLPTNAEGGRFGIQMTAPIKGLSGNYYACSAGISSKLAQQLDIAIDDGLADKGSLRAQEGAVTVATEDAAPKYNADKTYVVCQAF